LWFYQSYCNTHTLNNSVFFFCRCINLSLICCRHQGRVYKCILWRLCQFITLPYPFDCKHRVWIYKNGNLFQFHNCIRDIFLGSGIFGALIIFPFFMISLCLSSEFSLTFNLEISCCCAYTIALRV
jgi:hypothetical protein